MADLSAGKDNEMTERFSGQTAGITHRLAKNDSTANATCGGAIDTGMLSYNTAACINGQTAIVDGGLIIS
jgi:hypothetical protein